MMYGGRCGSARMGVYAKNMKIMATFVSAEQQQAGCVEYHCRDDISVCNKMGNDGVVAGCCYGGTSGRTSFFDWMLEFMIEWLVD